MRRSSVRKDRKELGGKRALVVGGSGGIGRGVSLMLAEEGASLVVHGGHDEARLEETRALCARTAEEVDGFLCPFDQGDVFLKEVASRLPFDIVVWCAGPVEYVGLGEASLEVWERMARGNLVLPGAVVGMVAGLMAERGHGRIVLFGGPGSDALRGYTSIAPYAAAKAGLGVLAKSVAVAYGSSNVACNVICPGIVFTEYTSREERERWREVPEARIASAEEVVDLVRYLVKMPTPLVNGAVISADKGLRL
ncbi:hypothetical protein STHERM_c00440 [Spirochaeta thermophila DSM 6192]|uniref:Short-chain dehydrogenase/reductase SDR n=1 Tax=Winmispira thermophila (strain ATCC 49972 / DSM 6192 / RI 19.B1) TaxID=665571 RepID=E0RTW4_WINT6|nr:hypothetical protein STHERM_c00440 [Spirochaeta thermophila DSM 6192]